DAADIFVAVFLAEAQPFRKVSAHRVAIQHFHPGVQLAQPLFQQIGNGALARAGHTREPERETFMHGALWSRPPQNGCRTLFWRLLPTTSGRPARLRRAPQREYTARTRCWRTRRHTGDEPARRFRGCTLPPAPMSNRP